MTARRWWVVHNGARDYYAAPRILCDHGQLARFYTDLWVPAGVPRWLRDRVPALDARSHAALPDAFVQARNLRSMLIRFKRHRTLFDQWIEGGSSLARWAVADIARQGPAQSDGVLGYTAGSLELMQFAASRGLLGVHAQVDPGLAWYRTRSEELRRWPGAEPDPGLPDAAFIDRLQMEWRTASRVIVNSKHAADSLAQDGVDRAKMQIVPLSAIFLSGNSPLSPPQAGMPFRVLFAGSVSVAKGFPYFAEAGRLLGSGFELHAAGAVKLTDSFLQSRDWNVTYHGHLPRSSLTSLMRSCHVLVFPTLSDGFGLVQLEAMAAGLPVVATESCGAVVEEGASGFVVPPRDAAAIAERVQTLRHEPDLFRQMSEAALRRVADFTPEAIAPLFLTALA